MTASLPEHPDSADHNSRDFSRVILSIRCEFTAPDGRCWSGLVRDLGLGGLYMTVGTPPASGQTGKVILVLDSGNAAVRVEAVGTVVRSDAAVAAMAIRFDEIYGADSFHHLKQLVLWNAGCAETIEREAGAHMGLHGRPASE